MPLCPRLLIALLVVALLGACGFHLRGQANLPFKTIYLKADNPSSELVAELRRKLEANQVQLVNATDQAEVTLDIASEISNKQILSQGNAVSQAKLVDPPVAAQR